jgi:hypothetical protein
MLLLHVFGGVPEILLVLMELIAILCECLLSLLQLLLLHDDVFSQTLGLLILVVDGDLGSQNLARVLDKVLH